MSKIWLPRWGIYGCQCMRDSLPLIEADMIAHGVIKERLEFYQGAYHLGTAASAGTHNGGGVADAFVNQGGPSGSVAQKVWEKWGVIDFYRYPPLFGYHNHCVWRGCEHQSRLCKQQQDGAVRSGWNGLARSSARYGQYGIVPKLTWQEAVKKYKPKPVPQPQPVTPEGWFDMSKLSSGARRIPIALAANTEVTLPINDKGDVSVVIGATSDFNVKVGVTVQGLTAGQYVRLRASQIDTRTVDGKTEAKEVSWGSADVQRVYSDGSLIDAAVTFDGSVISPAKGWSRRVRIKAVASEACTITRLVTRTRKA